LFARGIAKPFGMRQGFSVKSKDRDMSTGAWRVKKTEIKRGGDALRELGREITALEVHPDGTIVLQSRPAPAKPEANNVKQPPDPDRSDDDAWGEF
jgi:hypothetical protein